MKSSNFRNWVRIIWNENVEERQEYHELPYSIKEYWQRYKYWLKREYKFQQNQNGQKT
jgi:hypothetical protein